MSPGSRSYSLVSPQTKCSSSEMVIKAKGGSVLKYSEQDAR
jgi:hypothetical protein